VYRQDNVVVEGAGEKKCAHGNIELWRSKAAALLESTPGVNPGDVPNVRAPLAFRSA